eukprot:1157776-Pelagomonas_calceolata.AAC.2
MSMPGVCAHRQELSLPATAFSRGCPPRSTPVIKGTGRTFTCFLLCPSSSDEVLSGAIQASNNTFGQSPFSNPEHQRRAWPHSRPSQLSRAQHGSSQASSRRSQNALSTQQSPCQSPVSCSSPQTLGPHPALLRAGWGGSRSSSAGNIKEHPDAKRGEGCAGAGLHLDRSGANGHGLCMEQSSLVQLQEQESGSSSAGMECVTPLQGNGSSSCCSRREMQLEDSAARTRHKGNRPNKGLLPPREQCLATEGYAPCSPHAARLQMAF